MNNQSLSAMTLVLGAANAAFAIWLVVQIASRGWRRRARFWTVVGMTLILDYFISFGLACWRSERHAPGVMLPPISMLYRPVLALSSDGRLPAVVHWYACLGASKGADPVVKNGRLVWRNHFKSSIKRIPAHDGLPGNVPRPGHPDDRAGSK